MSLFFLAGGRVFPRQRVGDVEFQLECGQPISEAGAKSSWRGGGKLLGWEVRDKSNIFFCLKRGTLEKILEQLRFLKYLINIKMALFSCCF